MFCTTSDANKMKIDKVLSALSSLITIDEAAGYLNYTKGDVQQAIHIAQKIQEQTANLSTQEKKLKPYKSAMANSTKEVVTILSKAFPEINFKIVNDLDPAMRKNPDAFITQDGVYFNEDRFDSATPIHEMSHIFVLAASQSSDPALIRAYNEIMTQALNEEQMQSDIFKQAKQSVGSQSRDAALIETAGILLTNRSLEDLHAKMPNQTPKEIGSILKSIKKFWNRIVTKVMQAMGVYPNISKTNLDGVRSVYDIFNKFYDDIMLGRVVSDFSQAKLSRTMEVAHINRLAATAIKKTIGTFKQLESALMTVGDHDTMAKNSMYMDIKSGVIPRAIVGKVNSFSDHGINYTLDLTNKTGAAVNIEIEKVAKEIYSKRLEAAQHLLNVLPDFLNGIYGNPLEMSEDKLNEIFGKRNMTSEKLRELLIHCGLNTINGSAYNKVMMMDEYLKENPELYRSFDKSVLDINPMVVVHRDGKKGYQDVSIIDFNPYSIMGDSSAYAGRRLFRNYITDAVQDNYAMRFHASYVGLKQFQLGLLSIMLQNANPELNVRRIGTASLYNIGEYRMYSMRDIVRKLRGIFEYDYEEKTVKGVESMLDYFPKQISDIIRSKETYARNYDQDIFIELANSMYDNLDELASRDRDSEYLKTAIQAIEDFIVDPGNKANLMDALKFRQQYISSWRKVNPLRKFDEKKLDEEYRLIASALSLLRTRGKWENKENQHGLTMHYTRAIEDMPQDVVQTVSYILGQSEFAVQRMAEDEMAGVWDALKNLGKKQHLTVRPKEIFGKLFVNFGDYENDKIYNIDTLDKPTDQVWTGRIHFEEDAVTRAKGITPEELAVGKAIIDAVEKKIMDVYRHQLKDDVNVYSFNSTTKKMEIDQEKLNAAAQRLYDDVSRGWQKGTIPVLPMKTTEAMFSGKIWGGFKKFFSKLGKDESVYPEAINMMAKENNYGKIPSLFYSQIINTKQRYEMLGIAVDKDNKLYSKEMFEKNGGFSYDLEDVIKYFLVDINTKIIAEEDIYPAVEDALLATYEIEYKKGLKQDNTRKDIESELIKYSGQYEKTMDENIERTLRTAMKVKSYLGLSFSLPVALMSMTANNVNMIINSTAAKMSNPNNIFTTDEFFKAKAFIYQNWELTEKMMGAYQVWDRDRHTWLNDPKFKEAVHDWYIGRVPQIGNWFTDYLMRSQIMVAQMMHDGSLKAHSYTKENGLTFDPKKDERFKNYEKDPAQAALMNHLVGRLRENRGSKQGENPLPTKAYSFEDQGRFKWIAKEFAIGGYGLGQRAPGDSVLAVKLVSQFKQWLMAAAKSRFAKEHVISEGGFYEVKTSPDGKSHHVEWSNLKQAGSWRIVANMGLQHLSFIPAFRALKTATKSYTPEELANFNARQKFALYRTIFDTIGFAIGIFGMSLIGAMADDDKKAKAIRNSRLVRIFRDGFTSYMALTPFELKKLAGFDGSFIPVLGMLKSATNLLSFQGTFGEAKQFIPAMANYTLASELGDLFDNEQKKK